MIHENADYVQNQLYEALEAVGRVEYGERSVMRTALPALPVLLSSWSAMDMDQGPNGWIEASYRESNL